MNDSQVRAQRLNQLKKLSANLRQSTETVNGINYSIVKQILDAARALSQPLSLSDLKQYNHNKQEIPSLNFFSNRSWNDHQQTDSIHQKDTQRNHYNNPSKKKVWPSLSIGRSQSAINQAEMINLRQQNAELSQALLNLKCQLDRYHELDKNVKLKQNLVPFFDFQEELQVFTSKIFINQTDYDKIDFVSYRVKLELHSLVLSSLVSTHQKRCELLDITNVSYYSDDLIVITFEKKSQETNPSIQTVFLSFESKEQLQKWDLGIFINLEIVQSLIKKNQLFNRKTGKYVQQTNMLENPLLSKGETGISMELGTLNNSAVNNANIANLSDDSFKMVEDKQLLRAYIEAKEKQLQLRRLLNGHIVERIQEKKLKKLNDSAESYQKNHSIISPGELDNVEVEKESKRLGKSEKTLGLEAGNQQFKVQERHRRLRQQQESEYEQKWEIKNRQNSSPRRLQSELVNHNQTGMSSMFKTAVPNLTKLQTSELNVVLQQRASQQKSAFYDRDDDSPTDLYNPQHESQEELILRQKYKMEMNKVTKQSSDYEKPLLASQKSMTESEKRNEMQNTIMMVEKQKKVRQQKINNAYKLLQAGYEMTKYAQKGWQPHNKKVFISNDCKFICFQDVKNIKDIKRYLLTDIRNIGYPKIGKGVKKHTSNPAPGQFALIQFKDKTVELGSKNLMAMHQFIEQLKLVYNNLKAMS